MSEATNDTARELLGDGGQIEIRALRREDEADMLAAVGKTGAQSLQRRFLVMKRHFSDKERAFFMDIDFKNHVALVALAEETGAARPERSPSCCTQGSHRVRHRPDAPSASMARMR
jgi:hypothetical protein